MPYKKAVLIEIADTDLDKKYWEKLDSQVQKRVHIDRNDPNLLVELKDCDCLLLGFQIDVQQDIIDAAPDLKYIGVLATAYGTINIEYAAEKGIPVTNLAGYSTESVAEFTIAILLYQIRNIEEGVRRARANDYSFAGITARELKGSSFGVIGLGSIGNRVAELASGFGANVSFWNRTPKTAPFKQKELDDVLANSDYISLNVAETPDTINLLSQENINKIKPGTVIVSTVPPPIVNTDALAERLKQGDIVYISDHPDEMEASDLAKIKDFDNVVLTPPIAFLSAEARIAKQEIFLDNLISALDGSPKNKVN